MGAEGLRQRTGKPHIVLLVIDCGRPDHFSCYGYHRPTTPNIDRLAEQGVVYEDASSVDTASPLGHFALMSGQRDWGGRAWLEDADAGERAWFLYRRVIRKLGISDYVGGYDQERHSLLSQLRMQGYLSVGVSANQLVSPSTLKPYVGFDYYPEDELFAGVDDAPQIGKLIKKYGIADTKANRQAVYLTAERVMGLAMNTLEAQNPGLKSPFFLFMNVMDCHDPYLVNAGYKEDFGFKPTSTFNGDLRNRPALKDRGVKGRSSEWTYTHDLDPATVDLLRWNYDRCLGYVDSQVGVLLDWLEANHALEDTVFFVLADHAEYLGEYGRFGHSMQPTELQLHIPMVVSGSRYVKVGHRIAEPVSIVDVRPTIFNLLGVHDPFVHRSGRSLLQPLGSKDRRSKLSAAPRTTGRWNQLVGAERRDLTTNDQAILEERLRDLGYMD